MRLGLFAAALGLLVSVAACSSSGAKPDAGGGDAADAQATEAPVADGQPGDVTGPILDEAGAGGDRATDAPEAAVRDCYPACIAELRASCRYPAAGEGTCVLDTHAADGGVSVCYSNGVRSIQAINDAGLATHVTVTREDGTTTCYYQDRMMTGELEYSTASGEMVAKVIFHDDGSATVTCSRSGEVVQLSAATLQDPACNTVSVSSCSRGNCP